MNNTAITSGRLTVGKTYLFQNKADGSRSLNVWCNSTYPATNPSNVRLWKNDTDDTVRQWILFLADNDTNYVLKSVENSAKCLDLYTGNSTDVHLHFEVRGGSESEFPLGGISSNGFYTGTVLDPTPYL